MPSSVIKNYRYFPDSLVLRIEYLSGAVHDYLDVPQQEFDAFRAYQSKGFYLNKFIKPKYRYLKLV